MTVLLLFLLGTGCKMGRGTAPDGVYNADRRPTVGQQSAPTVLWNSYQPKMCHLFVLTSRANCCQTVRVFEEILQQRTAPRYSYTAQLGYSCALRASSSIHLAGTGPTRGCACSKRNSQLPVGWHLQHRSLSITRAGAHASVNSQPTV